MKKTLILCSLLAFACTNKNTEVLESNKKEILTKSEKDENVFVFSSKIGWDLTGKTKLSWQEADAKLKSILSNDEYKNSTYFDTFVQIAIQDIATVHGLLQSGNAEVIEFWFKELMKCKGQNPEIVYLMLNALKPYIGAEKTHQYAQNVLQKHNQYAENVGQKSLYKNEQSYNKLKSFVEKLQSL